LVVQDASGAIEVLVAADVAAPPVGTRLRLTGRVGVAYGAPRLRASILEHIGSGALPPPLQVRGPLTDGHTWRLVTVSGRVEDMKKLGDRWRAEVTVGAQRIVVVGQPGAGIDMAHLPEGAMATITGIVRRAYANAGDQRPSLLPRSSADIRLTSSATGGGAGATGRGATTGAGGAPASGAAAGPANARPSPGPALAASAVADADLRDLANVAGQKVRVGGLVTELTDVGFTLDDGTSLGAIVLIGSALEFRSLIEPGDAINVTGRVDRQDDATYAVTVEDGAAIVLGADLGEHPSVSPVASVASVASSAVAPAGVRAARLGDGFGTLPATGAGVASALLIALASLAVTLLRRRHARRLLASRIAARLAVFAGPPAATADGQAPERGLSVGHAR
ncbi:MAG: OB-fold nucleic acid binding domain-containing protein, partial [Candidatus Limnocylindrales bacterium]